MLSELRLKNQKQGAKKHIPFFRVQTYNFPPITYEFAIE
jgi:hypothetical protein